MLADDDLGATRERDEHPLPETYHRAFDAIDSQGAASEGSDSHRGFFGVAMDHTDPLCWYSKPVGHKLCPGGLVTLAARARAGDDGY